MDTRSDTASVFGDLVRSLSLAEQCYRQDQPRHKLELWRRVNSHIDDPRVELHDFDDAMRREIPVLRCSECVMVALMHARSAAARLIRQEFAGPDLDAVWPQLDGILQEVAVYSGGGIVLGVSGGAARGAFPGGAGAMHGRAAAGSHATAVRAWLFRQIGLDCLDGQLGGSVSEMTDEYSRGFAQAWRAGELDVLRTHEAGIRTRLAAQAFARGHLRFCIVLLSAIAQSLARGTLTRDRLHGGIAESRLGTEFARWIEANEDALLRHPRLE